MTYSDLYFENDNYDYESDCETTYSISAYSQPYNTEYPELDIIYYVKHDEIAQSLLMIETIHNDINQQTFDEYYDVYYYDTEDVELFTLAESIEWKVSQHSDRRGICWL
jgi:hypothetical protein